MKQENTKALDAELFGSSFTPTTGEDEVRLLGDLVRALWRARIWLFGIGFFAGVVGYALSYTSEVGYTSVAQVMIETRTSEDEFGPAGSGLPISVTALESELEVLRSHDLAQRVVDRLGLDQDPEFAGSDEDEGGIDLSPRAAIRAVKGLIADLIPAEKEARTEAEAAQTEEDLLREEVVTSVVSKRSVDQVGNVSAVFAIRFTSVDPRKAAVLANALAEEYLASQTSAKLVALERSQGWLSERTIELQERLSALGVELERQLLDAPFTVEEVETMKALRSSAERQLNTADTAVAEILELRRNVLILISQRNYSEAAALIPGASSELQTAVATATAENTAQLELALDAELDRLTGQIAQREAVVETLRAEIDQFRDALVTVAEHDAEARRIESDIRVSEAIYQDFVSQLSRRTQQDRFLNPDARIIAFARPSLTPSEPRRAQTAVLLALVAGFIASIVVMLQEFRQSGLRTVSDFEQATGLPVLGTIPRFRARNAPINAVLSQAGSIDPGLIQFARKLYSSFAALLYTQPLKPGTRSRSASMTPREVQAEVGQMNRKENQIIACASALDGEGKSSTMLLLAGACAYAGEKVLLIDCDFWHSPFRALAPESPSGYYAALRDPNLVDALVVDTDEDDVFILPAARGVEDPAALLLSDEFGNLVNALAQEYDRILIDTPAILQRIDIAALYRLANTVLMIVQWNSTNKGAVNSAIKALQDVGVTPSAVAATQVDTKRAAGYGDNPFAYANRSFT